MRRETFAVSGPLKLDLSVPAGEIEVEAAETDEAVVELEPLRDAEEAVEDARVELRGDELVVEVRDRRGWSAEVRLRVVAPLGSNLLARSGSADVRTRGRLGSAEVKAASGDVTIDEVDSLSSKLASGDLEAAKVAGDAKIESASGDVEVAHLGGDAAISSASGDVHLGEALGDLRIRTASGDQRIDALQEGYVELASASGDVRVGIRPGSRLQIDARSSSGDVTSELEVGDAPVDDQGPLVKLQVTAMSGDIEVVRAS
jgi:putative adhesin